LPMGIPLPGSLLLLSTIILMSHKALGSAIFFRNKLNKI